MTELVSKTQVKFRLLHPCNLLILVSFHVHRRSTTYVLVLYVAACTFDTHAYHYIYILKVYDFSILHLNFCSISQKLA